MSGERDVCPKCGDNLVVIPVSSEPEGIRRDRVCPYCKRWFMTTSAAFVEVRRPAPIGERSHA